MYRLYSFGGLILPFLLSQKYRVQDGGIAKQIGPKTEENADASLDGLEDAARDVCDAIMAKDYKKLASALRYAFLILDAAPHHEGPHTDESKTE